VSVAGASSVHTLTAGQTTSIEVESGSTLSFESSEPMDWSETLGGAEAVVGEDTDTAKELVLSTSEVAGTTSVFTLTSAAGGNAAVVITVAIPATRFEAGQRRVGEYIVWGKNETLDGRWSTDTIETATVSHVDADGSYSFNRPFDISIYNRGIEYSAFNAGENLVYFNRVLIDEWGGDHHGGCFYEPSLELRRFPLFVGKTWTSSWTEVRCDLPPGAAGTATTVVEAYEPVPVPAGTFDALRIRSVICGRLPAGYEGTQSEVRVCWWAVTIKRDVKCVSTWEYTTASPVSDSTGSTPSRRENSDFDAMASRTKSP